jgi:hypothetical protein
VLAIAPKQPKAVKLTPLARYVTPLVLHSSRLGCQVVVTKEMDGIRVTLPPATRNMAVDGFVPQPH